MIQPHIVPSTMKNLTVDTDGTYYHPNGKCYIQLGAKVLEVKNVPHSKHLMQVVNPHTGNGSYFVAKSPKLTWQKVGLKGGTRDATVNPEKIEGVEVDQDGTYHVDGKKYIRLEEEVYEVSDEFTGDDTMIVHALDTNNHYQLLFSVNKTGTPGTWKCNGWMETRPQDAGVDPETGNLIINGIVINSKYLNNINLEAFDLHGANLRGANLRCANLSKAYLYKADLSEANLSEADMTETEIFGADLSNVILTNTTLTLGIDYQFQSQANLHKIFDSEKYGRSLLSSIDSIPNSYRPLKIQLFHQVIDELAKEGITYQSFLAESSIESSLNSTMEESSLNSTMEESSLNSTMEESPLDSSMEESPLVNCQELSTEKPKKSYLLAQPALKILGSYIDDIKIKKFIEEIIDHFPLHLPQLSQEEKNQADIMNFHAHPEYGIASMNRPIHAAGLSIEERVALLGKLKANKFMAIDTTDEQSIKEFSEETMSKLCAYYSANPDHNIEDFFNFESEDKPEPREIDQIVQKIDERRIRFINSFMTIHCGAGDGRSGMVKSAFVMKQLLIKNPNAYLRTISNCNESVFAEMDDRNIPTNGLVRNAVDQIRASHKTAVEREEDIKVLTEYSQHLYDRLYESLTKPNSPNIDNYPHLSWLRDNINLSSAWADPRFECLPGLIGWLPEMRDRQALLVIVNHRGEHLQTIDPHNQIDVNRLLTLPQNQTPIVLQHVSLNPQNPEARNHYNLLTPSEAERFSFIRKGNRVIVSAFQVQEIETNGFCFTNAVAQGLSHAFPNLTMRGVELRNSLINTLMHANVDEVEARLLSAHEMEKILKNTQALSSSSSATSPSDAEAVKEQGSASSGLKGGERHEPTEASSAKTCAAQASSMMKGPGDDKDDGTSGIAAPVTTAEAEDEDIATFYEQVRRAPTMLEEERKRLQALKQQKQAIFESATERYESSRALTQATQEDRENVLSDIFTSLKHGSRLKDESSARSALLLSSMAFSGIPFEQLAPGTGIILLDEQNRYWRFTASRSAVERNIVSGPQPGDILIKLPRPFESAKHAGVEVRRIVSLPEEESKEDAPNDSGYRIAIFSEKKPVTWQSVDSPKFAQEEQLFTALAQGLALSKVTSPAQGTRAQEAAEYTRRAEALRGIAWQTFLMQLGTKEKEYAQDNIYTQYKHDDKFMDASAALWDALKRPLDTCLNAFYVLDTTFREVLKGLADTPEILAKVLLHDRCGGLSISQQLAETLRENFSVTGLAGRRQLDEEAKRLLADYCRIIHTLMESGVTNSDQVKHELSRGGYASLEELARENPLTEPGVENTSSRETISLKDMVNHPIVTEEVAMQRHQDSLLKDPRKQLDYQQKRQERNKQILKRGFGEDVMKADIALEEAQYSHRFDPPETAMSSDKVAELRAQRNSKMRKVRKNVEIENALIELDHYLHTWAEARVKPAATSIPSRARHQSLEKVPVPLQMQSVSPQKNPVDASRNKPTVHKPQSLSRMPTLSSLNQGALPAESTPSPDASLIAQHAAQTPRRLASMPSVTSLSTQSIAPSQAFEASQSMARTRSLSRMPSSDFSAGKTSDAPAQALNIASQVSRTQSLSRLPSVNRLAPLHEEATPSHALNTTSQVSRAQSLSRFTSQSTLLPEKSLVVPAGGSVFNPQNFIRRTEDGKLRIFGRTQSNQSLNIMMSTDQEFIFGTRNAPGAGRLPEGFTAAPDSAPLPPRNARPLMTAGHIQDREMLRPEFRAVKAGQELGVVAEKGFTVERRMPDGSRKEVEMTSVQKP